MSRQQWLSIIGVWVMVFLYLGIPSAWDKIFAVCTGLIIILISFKFSARHSSKSHGHSGHSHAPSQSAYVENSDQSMR